MKGALDQHLAAYEGQNAYDFDNEIILTWYPERILELAGRAKSILELGLGHGFATSIFSERFSRHVVVEGSSAVIQSFNRRFPNCRPEISESLFEQYDTRERFDVIVMGFILEHVDNPSEIVARFRRFLSPRGKMFVAVPNAEALNRRIGHLAGILPDIQQLTENDQLLGHKRYYTVKSLTEDLRSAGCQVVRMEGIYLKPLTTEQMVSLKLEPGILKALCSIGIHYPELSLGILAQVKVPR